MTEKKWQKAPLALIELFERNLPANERIERRKMFGYPCVFVGGNMFSFVHESNLVVRLDEEKRNELLDKGWRNFQPMGRVMREYLELPHHFLENEIEVRKILQESFDFAKNLPLKIKKERKKK